ncbi:hypothetical protein [Pseudocitrobacter vendiensis]|uniref:Uncharacterized protein n=1 Tax=Pseudocitrobacter vendiensis TaxID=2488306 RepID=A0ABN8T6Y4_9ENTR|nr:hypothetical protein [Pseudocitrobacter vendiensis]CAH6636017.1 hypothetical protein FBBNIHIM_04210 [Pseudocitrobacter vendiensis]
MQPLQRLTAEKLAAMPAGTRLKFGGQIVKLAGRGSFRNSAGHLEEMIEYVDSRGVPGSFAESIFLASATEHLNAVMCDQCGALRHPKDCVVRTISTYMTTKQGHFCDDKGCADRFFILHPNRQQNKRRTRW